MRRMTRRILLLPAALVLAACSAPVADEGMDAATACETFIEHMNTATPISSDLGWDIAGAWLHSGDDDLYRAAFVLFDGTPDVDEAWPYITAGCSRA